MTHTYSVGDIVLVEDYDGHSVRMRPRPRDRVYEAEVTKVGRKYVHVRRKGYTLTSQYHIDTGKEKTDFTPRSRIHADWDAFDAFHERIALERQVRDVLNRNHTNWVSTVSDEFLHAFLKETTKP